MHEEQPLSDKADGEWISYREKSDIRVHLSRDGLYFCTVDTDDVRIWDQIETIEAEFYHEDDAHRVTDSLLPEQFRGAPAPVVGTVEHTHGDIMNITFDLSEWYGNGS